jgi:short-subunit dehydrogenase
MKNVLITGCSRGLGYILSNELIRSGCNVTQHFRKENLIHSNLEKHVIGDIREKSTLERIDKLLKEHKINVFVNNAAAHYRKPFLEHSDSEISSLIAVNVTSQILMLKRVYNHFITTGDGLIINVNSIAGIQPAPNESIYSATKYALKGFSQSLQIESIGKNVRIVDIFPGAMKTDMTRDRENYDTLINPAEVANRIRNVIISENTTSLETEIVVRKFNKR